MSAVKSVEDRPIRVALLGCGVVGSQVARLILEQADDLTARVGAPVELAGIAVRRLGVTRDTEIPADLFTTDAEALVTRDDVDIVVEVIGGIEPARPLILSALANGAGVVTANKALLAEDGATLFDAARDDIALALHEGEGTDAIAQQRGALEVERFGRPVHVGL